MIGEIEGIVEGHIAGHGHVVRDDAGPDIYLAPEDMRAVLHRDRVKVRIVRQDRRGRPQGQVVEILQRQVHTIIGRLLQEQAQWLVAPEDRRYGLDVMIPKKAIGGAHAGQVVVAELTEPPALYGRPVGRVLEVLGEVDDPGLEIEIAVRKYGVPHQFSEACRKAAAALPAEVLASERRGRVDLTDLPLVTIDGEDARDFDDAVYCEPAATRPGARDKDGWRLLVAIADVSHYVKSAGAIDIDAYERATSVYFPRRVIPMLPEKLSNGICSLNPGVERLCMVCDMVVAADGEVTAYQFYPAVMRSGARLTYELAAAMLANVRGPEATRNADLLPRLTSLEGVFRALLAARERRGAIDFDTVETEIVCNEAGRIEAIVPSRRTEAHRLIEECMLAANVCAADFVSLHRQAALFRVHGGPSAEKVAALRAYFKALGLPLSVSDEPAPRELQQIVAATSDRPDAAQIQMQLLRSMKQATYTPVNTGHFGLAYEAYAHFTSPIRRYPDLLVHRVIKAILAGKPYRLHALPAPGDLELEFSRRLQKNGVPPAPGRSKPGGKSPASSQERWELAGLHCSACERRADEASRDVEAWLKCDYMRQRLGQEYAGAVSAVTSFGLFITLNDLYVEGLVHISELGSEYFNYDEVRQELRGEHTGMRYLIGTPVRVQVSRVDLDARRIDFRLLPDEGGSRPESAARPARAGTAARHSDGSDRRPRGGAGKAGGAATVAKSRKTARTGAKTRN